jgi:hypothetical protein
MKKIYPAILVAVAVVTALLTWSCSSRSQQPVHNGKTLNEWVSDLNLTNTSAVRIAAQNEIRQIGTNSLPFLLKEMDDLGIIWGGGVTNFDNTPGARDRDVNLHSAFKVLGAIARPAVPDLVAILNNNTNGIGEIAAFALVQIDPQIAAVAFNQALTNNIDLNRLWALKYITQIGTNADIAVANLIRCLKDQSADKDMSFRIRQYALGGLIFIHAKSEQIVPVLIDELRDDDIFINRYRAAQALGNLGKQAPQAAIPILVQMSTNDPNKDVRAAATTALQKIQAVSP